MLRKLLTLFVDPEHHRLRALWRLLIHTLLLAVFGFVSLLVVQGSTGAPTSAWLFTLISALLVVLPVTWLCGTRLDRRRFADFGFHLDRRWWLDLGFGLTLGVVLMSAIFVIELELGWLDVRATKVVPEGFTGPFALAMVQPLVLFLAVGFYEELLSRGYHLRNMAEGVTWRGRIDADAALIIGTILSSTLFGLLHADNPNATALSTINVALAGGFLAIGVLTTGELAIPIGIHVTWNFCQGNVFGFPVSGTDAGARFYAVEQSGDPLITGGQFGPEAGLIGVAAMLAGSAAILVWVKLTRGELRIHRELVQTGRRT
ncbi:CPBP family intramembrane glutamic endopeptidase [Nannocystaceae bacterium ST9]